MSATKSTPAPVLLYRFGPYEADISRNQLRKFGLRVRLERKPWQLLIALLQRPGELVTRLELQRALWGDDVFVDFEHGLNVAVKKLRGALNDSAEAPVYVETVAGQGYRFIAEVERVVPDAAASPSAESIGDPLTRTDSFQLLAVRQPEERAAPLPAGGARQFWLQKRKVWSAAAVLVCAALLAVAAAKLDWRRLRQPVRPNSGRTMLVVLPFQNLSGDPSQEYLSDGITEELSARLGNLNPQQLGVIGRTSAMVYKQSARPISQIGKELAVGYVLEGSVRRNEGMLRVTAQLVKVSDQTHVWAETYDRSMRDLLQVEDEVASSIARQVGVSIRLDPTTRFSNHDNPSSEAHEDYLLGRYYWNKRTPAAWQMAARHFRRALEKDPQYAAAYAGLAECRIPPGEAKAAALKAVELDPTSAEARTALGRVQLYRYLDMAAAEDTFRTAIRLDPNYPIARHSYSELLEVTGRLQEAIIEKRQAMALDPLSLVIKGALAEALSLAGQHSDAEKEIKLVLEMDPHFPSAHGILGSIYLRKGMYEQAIREYQASDANGGDKAWGPLGYAYARSGDMRNALRVLSQLQELQKRTGAAPFDLALVQIGLNHNDEALATLERAYRERTGDDSLLSLRVDPMFDPLRADPRFQDLLRRLNFPP